MKVEQFWAAVSRTLAVMTATLIIALILAPGAWAANTEKVLYSFTGGSDGAQPEDALVFDASGNLYGTSVAGGCCGNGTVFELTPNPDGTWTQTVLYSFTGGSDGGGPVSAVTFDASGNLYGTSVQGGDYGDGAVYMLTPTSGGTWTENVIHSFNGSDGAHPTGGLTFDTNGNLFGTTWQGGARGHGVVFILTPNTDGTWTESVIHSFKGGKDGGTPDRGHLIFDSAGNLYGATAGWYGGASAGTVFELTPDSDGTWTESVIHSFEGGKDGAVAEGTLIFDPTGSLYGTTYRGGAHGYGTVFKLTPGTGGAWTKTVLHQFKGGKDGANPFGGVVFDTAGNLYGPTHGGDGTVFKLVPNSKGEWTEQMLHRFKGGPDGLNPWGGVVLDAAGNVYGTTVNGGPDGEGVIYEITP